MRRALGAALPLGLALAALATASPAGADFGEPVSVTANVPERVPAGSPFRLEVVVAAEAGALDIAAQPLRVRVRLAPECGGSFAGTEGPTALDKPLPAPSPGAAYSASVAASVKIGATGTETVCAFLEDAQERQFATDTEAVLTVVSGGGAGGGGGKGGCTATKSRLRALRRDLRHLDRRARKLRVRLRRAHDQNGRRALKRRLRKLRHRRHRLVVKRRHAKHAVGASCG